MTQTFNIFNEYARWTDSTAQYPVTAEAYYLALGIADEIGEFNSAIFPEDRLKEAGDSLWYIARYCTRVLEVSFGEIAENVNPNKVVGPITVHIGIIAGVEKKRIRDGQLWNAETIIKKKNAALAAVENLLIWIGRSLAVHNLSLEDAVRNNMDKLNKRVEANTIRGDGDNR